MCMCPSFSASSAMMWKTSADYDAFAKFGSARYLSTFSLLASNYQQLHLHEDGSVDTESELGQSAVKVFLVSLAETAEALGLRSANRAYRANFTINYRALFPDESRNYKFDVLVASLEQHSEIWVNGDKFELDAETLTSAQTVAWWWTELCMSLSSWNSSDSQQVALAMKLVSLDTAWAAFEYSYISDLINIETRPRQLVLTAINEEQKLTNLETMYGHQAVSLIPEYIGTQRSLVQSISHLNSVANNLGKGRDDLSVEILWDAMKTMQIYDASEKKGCPSGLGPAA
eukprot:TRINITY_DN2570_c0_g1_i4.p1 TRINITY_DN2570_c0_g1~~TRINITY_DN2570_c0_g1_i4.p1  ORF type:complete len:287 (+),score=54.72 TRINITY_DN2570_c0_g1_i4:46-906(+)